MGATIEALQSLQKVELQLNALRAKIDAKKRSVRVHQRKFRGLDQDIKVKHEEIKRLQANIDAQELEVRTRDAEITKLREALNRSKSNKEYAAILTQINTDKADNSKVEDRILEMMNQLEAMKEQERQLGERQSKEQQALEHAQSIADDFEQESQGELQSLSMQRDDAASLVPATALEVFKRVADRHGGEALAVVLQPHPKRHEFVCDGCNMNVTLEQYSALQSQDDFQVCNNCGRVLVLADG